MRALAVTVIVFLILCSMVLLIFHIKSRRPIRSIFLNALLGIAAIALINITQKFTGVHIPLNWWTVGGSAVFGIPAVCGIVILQMIL